MSDEERKDLPPEPDAGRSSEPFEDARGESELPEERLGEQLGNSADSVTRDLRDLQDELMPPTAEELSATRAEREQELPAPTNETKVEEPSVPFVSGAPIAASPVSGYQRSKSGSNFTPEGTNDDRLMSMLAWLSMVILQLPVVAIIQLLSENTKDRSFQRHHAITSLLFYGAGIVYEVLATVVFTILTAATLGCGAVCLWVIFFVPHVLGLYYALQAYNGKRVTLPFLSDLAQRQGWM